MPTRLLRVAVSIYFVALQIVALVVAVAFV
jgi:hypothetical protein